MTALGVILAERSPLAALAARYRVPGAQLARLEAGAPTEALCVGVADERSEFPVTPSTRFQVASVSKIVTAWAALALVADGCLDLDEPIRPHLRRWRVPGGSPRVSKVTLRALLSHTAGMPAGVSRPRPEPNELPTLIDVVAGRADMAAAVPTAAPGTGFCYSNPGYALVQLLVEDVSGEEFVTWAQHRILDPLGMTNSTFDRSPRAGDAGPHRRTGRRLADGFVVQRASGGLLTTASDLVVLARAMTTSHEHGRGGGVLPTTLVEESWHCPETALGAFHLRNGGYALGQISARLPNGSLLVANQGSQQGWRALFGCLPDEGHAIAIVTNSVTGSLLLAHLGLSWLAHLHNPPLSLRHTFRIR